MTKGASGDARYSTAAATSAGSAAAYAVAPDRIDPRVLAGEPFVLFPRQLGPGLYDRMAGRCHDDRLRDTLDQLHR